MTVLNLLQKNLLSKTKGLTDICEKNKYTLQFLLTMAELRRAKTKNETRFKDLGDHDEGSDNEIDENNEDMQLQSKWSDESE